ncbi:GGDEF domain-containing protein [Vibrio sp. AK197]
MLAQTALALASIIVCIFGLVGIQLIHEPKGQRRAKPFFSGFFLTGMVSAYLFGNLSGDSTTLYEVELVAVTAIHQWLFLLGLAIRFASRHVERLCYVLAFAFALLYAFGLPSTIITICFSILTSLVAIAILVMRRPAPNSADICLALTVLLSFSLSLFDIASGTQRLSFLDMEMDDFILHLVFVPAVICGQSIFLLASYMIDNNRNLMRLAQKDSLTNMLNRRAFYEQLNQYYQELKESHGQGAIIIADIDFFKKINDTYGHEAGDQGLLHFESIISQSIRDSDIAARYGGEEFVIFLPGADLPKALEVAERMRLRCETSYFNYKDYTIKFTSSFGVAECLFSAQPDATVAMADKALYEAKTSGRNRVCYLQL